MKVIIAGGRDFSDYGFLEAMCDRVLSKKVLEVKILSGGQQTYNKERDVILGADYLGERYAHQKGYPLKIHYANWDKYGRKAGPIRNGIMAKEADALIAFWDKKSKGTKNMIETAKRYGLKIRVFNY